MKEILTSSVMFGLALSLFTYSVGVIVKKRFGTPFANPLLIGIILTIIILTVFKIDYSAYNNGGVFITMFLGPATAVIGLSIYRQMENLKKNFMPIICGCAVGSVVSIICSIVFCKLFGLSDRLLATMIPRAATSPIAMEISAANGGMVSVTVAMVILSGIIGAVFAPVFVKVLKMKNRVAVGVAIGTSSSAAGTAKAIEMGETEGAMSGLAVGITGLMTVVLAMFI